MKNSHHSFLPPLSYCQRHSLTFSYSLLSASWNNFYIYIFQLVCKHDYLKFWCMYPLHAFTFLPIVVAKVDPLLVRNTHKFIDTGICMNHCLHQVLKNTKLPSLLMLFSFSMQILMNVKLVMAVVNITAQTTLAASHVPVLLATLSTSMDQLVMVCYLLYM